MVKLRWLFLWAHSFLFHQSLQMMILNLQLLDVALHFLVDEGRWLLLRSCTNCGCRVRAQLAFRWLRSKRFCQNIELLRILIRSVPALQSSCILYHFVHLKFMVSCCVNSCLAFSYFSGLNSLNLSRIAVCCETWNGFSNSQCTWSLIEIICGARFVGNRNVHISQFFDRESYIIRCRRLISSCTHASFSWFRESTLWILYSNLWPGPSQLPKYFKVVITNKRFSHILVLEL